MNPSSGRLPRSLQDDQPCIAPDFVAIELSRDVEVERQEVIGEPLAEDVGALGGYHDVNVQPRSRLDKFLSAVGRRPGPGGGDAA